MLEVLRNVYGYESLPSDIDSDTAYWNSLLQQATITPEQYEAFKQRFVRRNTVGILEAVSASLDNILYVPLSRTATLDTASYYQVIDTDFSYFVDVITPEELLIPQDGTFFMRPNQADAHIDYNTQYIVYFVTNGKVYRMPNYQTLEVELVERKLTYDSIQIFENEYIDAVFDKVGVDNWNNRTSAWRPQFSPLAVYRPFPPSEYFLQTNATEVYEGQFFFIRLSTRRVPAGRKFKYQITGVDQADIDIPLEGVFITAGTEAVAGSTVRVNVKRDKRTDGVKTMVIAVDIPYDQTYGGGLRLEQTVDILDRSVTSDIILPGEYRAQGVPSISILSKNNRYAAVYQPDGNFVIRDVVDDRSIRGIGYGSAKMSVQLDGNVVWYAANGTTVIDNTATSGNGPTYMRIGNDGVLRLYRMLDDVELWNSVTNLTGPMLAPFNSDLVRLRNALPESSSPAGNVSSGQMQTINGIWNTLDPRTRSAILANSGNQLLFGRDPGQVSDRAQLADMRFAINEFITSVFSRIRNVRYPGFTDYYVYLNQLQTQATELPLPDKPIPPFESLPGQRNINPIFGPGAIMTASLAPPGFNPAQINPNLGGGGSGGPGGGGGSPFTRTAPPTIVQGQLNPATLIRTVTVTHPSASAVIKTAFGTGTEEPATPYVRNNPIIGPTPIGLQPGQTLRAIAKVGDESESTVTSYTNTVTQVPVPTIAFVSTNTQTNIQTVRVSHPIPGAQIKVSLGVTSTPQSNAANNSTVNVGPSQTLRVNATVAGVTSTIVQYVNNLPSILPPPNNNGAGQYIPPPGG